MSSKQAYPCRVCRFRQSTLKMLGDTLARCCLGMVFTASQSKGQSAHAHLDIAFDAREALYRLPAVNAYIRCHDKGLRDVVISWSSKLVSKPASQPMPSLIEIVRGFARSRRILVECRFRQATLQMPRDTLAGSCRCMVLRASQSKSQSAHAQLEIVFEARIAL